MEGARAADERAERLEAGIPLDMTPEQIMKRIKTLEAQMMKLARNLEFEEAARLRDEISQLRSVGLGLGGRKAV
jgi:excinuclease ABC subunit B